MSKKLQKRIEELEERVRQLEARPIVVPMPVFVQPVLPAPQPYYVPAPVPFYGHPLLPIRDTPVITCGGTTSMIGRQMLS